MLAGKCNIRGFTLIELMIVIAIVAILVALAVPAYKDFVIRAKVGECIAAGAPPKLQISEYQETTGNWPVSAASAGIIEGAFGGPRISKFCAFYSYNNGEGDFFVRVDPTVIGLPNGWNIIPVFSPTANAQGGVDWLCTYGFTTVSAYKYLPTTCKNDNIWQN